MYNREHVVILRPPKRIAATHHVLLDEIRQVEEFRTDTSLIKERELDSRRP